MNHPRTCPRCGANLPQGGALQGLCPACMLRQDVEGPPEVVVTGSVRARPEIPDLAAIQRDFPQLELLDLVGRGGMGLVYKARQRRLDRLVALKVLAPELAADPAFAERFLREAQALAKLDHPNIVTVYDFGERNGRYFLLMEYVDGTSLRQLLEDGSLAPPAALQLVPELCAGLQYAHEQGIVHRDIKPENILVDRNGRVKIADFGLVKLLDKDEGDWRLTRASQIMGTPQYMAPEQMNRPQEVDHRADIYSLGVVLYEMLTAELPTGRFALPSEKVRVDVRLDEVVLKALEREPERRFQKVADMGTRVETISNDTVARGRSGSSGWSRRPERPRRHGRTPNSDRARDEGGPLTGRRIPFKNEDKWGGIYVANGLVGLVDDKLVIEYRMHDCLDFGSGPAEVIELDMSKISAVEFKNRFFGGGQLIITGSSLDFSDEYPQFRPGAIRLNFDKHNLRRASELAEHVDWLMDQPRA